MAPEAKINKIYSGVAKPFYSGVARPADIEQRYWVIDSNYYWASDEDKWPLEIYLKIIAWKKIYNEEDYEEF